MDRIEQYVNAYNQLGVVFLETYMYSTVLDTIESLFTDEQENTKECSCLGILTLFVELAKKEFVMNICKIGGESGKYKDAISLQMLDSLSDNFINDGVIEEKPDTLVSDSLQRIQTTAKCFRDKYIAHLDNKRELDVLKISDLRDLLDRYKEIYDGYAYDRFEGIIRLTKNEVESTKANCSIALGLLFAKLKQ